MKVLENLEPKKVFHYFEEICSIPHGSRNTKQISDYLVDFAKAHGLTYYQDELNNVVIIKEASKGYENAEPVIIQGHMDMVCEKEKDCDIDFEKEGLRLYVEGDFVKAKDTTLGGDDGIAVAYALAILDSDELAHPRLEVVITVDEEIGMLGAIDIDLSMLKGHTMLNLDSDEEGHFLTSCAGGMSMITELPVKRVSQSGLKMLLTVTGLEGGHSGSEIHKEHGNANILMGRLLKQIMDITPFGIISMDGGLKDNAIPRECVSVFASNDDFEKIKEAVLKVENDLKEELKESDEHVFVRLEKVDSLNEVISVKESQDIISMMYLMPNGFMHKSLKMDLTNISLNMGVVEMNEKFNIYFSIRSPMESAKDELSNKLSLIASMFKAKYILDNNYPGWNYDEGSKLRKQYVDFVKETEEITLKEEGTHSGLETGIFKGALQDLDIITLGPDMFDIHTPDERLNMNSFYKCYQRLIHFLERL